MALINRQRLFILNEPLKGSHLNAYRQLYGFCDWYGCRKSVFMHHSRWHPEITQYLATYSLYISPWHFICTRCLYVLYSSAKASCQRSNIKIVLKASRQQPTSSNSSPFTAYIARFQFYMRQKYRDVVDPSRSSPFFKYGRKMKNAVWC